MPPEVPLSSEGQEFYGTSGQGDYRQPARLSIIGLTRILRAEVRRVQSANQITLFEMNYREDCCKTGVTSSLSDFQICRGSVHESRECLSKVIEQIEGVTAQLIEALCGAFTM